MSKKLVFCFVLSSLLFFLAHDFALISVSNCLHSYLARGHSIVLIGFAQPLTLGCHFECRAIEIMCDSDERATAAPQIFRAAISHEINSGELENTVSLLLQFGVFCEEKNLQASQNRAYLGMTGTSMMTHLFSSFSCTTTFWGCICCTKVYTKFGCYAGLKPIAVARRCSCCVLI